MAKKSEKRRTDRQVALRLTRSQLATLMQAVEILNTQRAGRVSIPKFLLSAGLLGAQSIVNGAPKAARDLARQRVDVELTRRDASKDGVIDVTEEVTTALSVALGRGA